MGSRSRLVIAYWADTRLAFVAAAQARCAANGVDWVFHQISHHAEWFTERRSALKNAEHLARTFAQIILSSLGSDLCIFGTNACRILYFCSWLFGRTHYVYNELPENNARSPLYWLDWLIFRTSRSVFVSSESRADYIRTLYGLKRRIGVVENISFGEIPPLSCEPRDLAAVYAGSVTPKRFPVSDIEKFRTFCDQLRAPITVYGVLAKALTAEFSALLVHRGSLPHADLLRLLPRFKYALLSYYREEPNYDLCAPIKLYEYVAAGCIVLSINNNIGLVRLAEQYPHLISFLSGGATLQSPEADDMFLSERESLLSRAIRTNQRLARIIVRPPSKTKAKTRIAG